MNDTGVYCRLACCLSLTDQAPSRITLLREQYTSPNTDFLLCYYSVHIGATKELSPKSPKAFLVHLHSHYKSLIRVSPYAVMLQRSCCSTLPRAQHLVSHITFSFYCFPELGVVCCYGHGLVNNCDIHLNRIR